MESLKHRIKYLLRWIKMPVQKGPLKGLRWIVTSGKHFITGSYEPYKTRAFQANLKEGDIVVDVGAHVGYYSALASLTVGDRGRVFSFEPRPLNIGFFKDHVRVNALKNITLYEGAISVNSGEATFNTNTGTGTGHLSEQGHLKVKTYCLDDLVEAGEIPRLDFLKIDVEGGEIDVLKGSRNTIVHNRPRMLLATHSEDTHAFVLEFLEEHNYQFQILDKDGSKGDTEIIALPMDVAIDS